MKKKKPLLPAIMLLLLLQPLFAGTEALGRELSSPAPAVDAVAIAIIDYANGDVLYESNSDLIIPPASLTKLMTLHVAYEAIARGEVQKSTVIDILPQETSPQIPYGSSLMYLQPGMRVPFLDLMRGMAVVSGNDAAFTVARVLAGSSEKFSLLMNKEAEKLGLVKTRFVEPSGLSEFNATTAREMAAFSRFYLMLHPESLAELHSLYSMEFPRADVMPAGAVVPAHKIMLRNRNDLIFDYPGCDGLKTGFIYESGYNLVATAERDGTRLILVTLGGVKGTYARTKGAEELMDWTFDNWKTVSPELPAMDSLRVWGSKARFALPVPRESPSFTVNKKSAGNIRVRAELAGDLRAPIAAGTKVGQLIFSSEDQVLRRIDLVMPADLPKGNIFLQFGDMIHRFFLKLFSR